MTGNNFPALSKKPTPPPTPPATPRGWTATSPRRTDIVEGRQRTGSERLSITNPEKPVKLGKPEPKPRDLTNEFVAWDGPPPDLPQSPSSRPLEIEQAEKPVSEKKPRAKPAQLKKHQATRSLDFQGVKAKAEKPIRREEPPPREKRLMVEPAEKIRKTGKVSTSELIDGFVNGLRGIEGAPPISEKLIDQLGQALSNHAIENELKPKFKSFGPKEVDTALAKMREMTITALGSGTPLYFACLVALEARQEALKAEPAKRAAIPKPPSLHLSKMADALADLGDTLAEGSKKVSKLISPRKLFASGTPKREPMPLEPPAPPAPEPDRNGVDAMADFISQRDRNGLETSFYRLCTVILEAEANTDAIDSWIDATLKVQSTEDLESFVAILEKGLDVEVSRFKEFQHQLSGRIWADLVVRQLLKNPDANENADLAAAYDGLNDYVLHDEADKTPALKVEPLFVRALKHLSENELETLAELPPEGYIDAGLKGALETVREKN